VSLLINKKRGKQTKKAARVAPAAFCKKLGKPCDASVLLHRAGAQAEDRVKRTPAHQSCGKGDDADIAPDRQHAGCSGADQAEAGHDTQDFVETANIAFHDVLRQLSGYVHHFIEPG